MKSLYRSIDTRIPTEILELTSDLDIAALYFPRLIESTSALCQRIAHEWLDVTTGPVGGEAPISIETATYARGIPVVQRQILGTNTPNQHTSPVRV